MFTIESIFLVLLCVSCLDSSYDANGGDEFGYSASISGDYAIVGSSKNDYNGIDSGSAYIFHRSGDEWIEETKLVPADYYDNDEFGCSVSISGEYAIIGAHRNDDNGSSSGAAYIFHRSGDEWFEKTKLLSSDGDADDEFGKSVSISGNYAIIGAVGKDDYGANTGAAYVFYRSGEEWMEQTKLLASDAASFDQFGTVVSISGDYAIIGAPWNSDFGMMTGSAYIFHRNGTDWIEQEKLLASDAAPSDQFGSSVSISGDYAVVGGAYNDSQIEVGG